MYIHIHIHMHTNKHLTHLNQYTLHTNAGTFSSTLARTCSPPPCHHFTLRVDIRHTLYARHGKMLSCIILYVFYGSPQSVQALPGSGRDLCCVVVGISGTSGHNAVLVSDILGISSTHYRNIFNTL